jgi:hypothetical protein
MKRKLTLALFALSLIAFFACEEGPGEGGTSTIRGKVITREYNGDFTISRGEYPAAKEDVYIIYGEDFVYGDRFETSFDGAYEFNYLRPGSYMVFAYSKDSTNLITDERIAVVKEVEITKDNQIVEVPDIIILK